jgi:hypothetical protein
LDHSCGGRNLGIGNAEIDDIAAVARGATAKWADDLEPGGAQCRRDRRSESAGADDSDSSTIEHG